MKRVHIVAIASLLAGCTINVPNGTFNTNAPVTATANTQVTAQVNASAIPTPPSPSVTELPQIVLTPTPTPTPSVVASIQPTTPTPEVTPSPGASQGNYPADQYWRYSAAKFEFIYSKGWENYENSLRSSEFSTCVASLGRKSPTGYSDFGVFVGKKYFANEDMIAYLKSKEDVAINKIEDFILAGTTGKTVYYSVFKNGVQTYVTNSFFVRDGLSYEILFSTTEHGDREKAIVDEINVVLNTWTWR